ncbi:ECF transporter S component [Clostridium tarantellae]|uniref:ECF transporter S component n=1 Tax=Clostridium tarantellae TaxID=39493 RepID=A0A6I1MIB3_9CLOT|nr:ECF transporter S component [Clostridium tarantellae]MPQ43115.1 ECF transporter S component [Clostridium tarantellae]
MNTTYQKSRQKTRKLVIIGMLSSISIFLGLTGLGFIAIPPVKATIMHIPVIIGAILEGPIVGGLIGLVFGLFSMYQSFTAPTPTSFIFWNPLIALLPRILIGVGSYYIYIWLIKGVKKNIKLTSIVTSLILSILMFLTIFSITKSSLIALVVSVILFILSSTVMLKFKHKNKCEALSIGTSAVLGTLINTIGVLGLTYIFYLEKYASALSISKEAASATLLTIGVTNGIPEAFISAIIAIPVIIGVSKVIKK